VVVRLSSSRADIDHSPDLEHAMKGKAIILVDLDGLVGPEVPKNLSMRVTIRFVCWVRAEDAPLGRQFFQRYLDASSRATRDASLGERLTVTVYSGS
tara:strand:- start:6045 stop:6335 length:291 start_codon:yes stop_codon:yes gene_type:complete